MSYAKLNVLHWHIIDEESFPLEVPAYPNLWKGSYTKWERYTVEDAYEIVKLQDRNMTAKDAYKYFVLKAQEIAISKKWTPVNWEETFNTFAANLNPQTVVHKWSQGCFLFRQGYRA